MELDNKVGRDGVQCSLTSDAPICESPHHAVSLDWATFVVERSSNLRIGKIYFKVGCNYTRCLKEP